MPIESVEIKIRKQDGSFTVVPEAAKINRGGKVNFDSDAPVRLSFRTNRDWFKPDLPEQAVIQPGRSVFVVRRREEKQFPPGQKQAKVQYDVEDAAQTQGAGADPDIIIEEC